MAKGPTKYLTEKDKANLHKAAVQAGGWNFLGEQEMVTVPKRSQSHVDAVPTQLAYVTQKEIDLLIKLNIHGTLDGKPNNGPGGLISLDDWTVSGGRVTGQSGVQESAREARTRGETGQERDLSHRDRQDTAQQIAQQQAEHKRNQEQAAAAEKARQERWKSEEAARLATKSGFDRLTKEQKFQEALRLQKMARGDLGTLTPEELQLMRDSGLLAMEASGAMDNWSYESEINRLKEIIKTGGDGSTTYGEALAELARLHGSQGKPNEELAKINALGIQEYLNRKTKGDYDRQEDILSKKTGIEGLSPDFFDNFLRTTGNVEEAYFDKTTGKRTVEGAPNSQLGVSGDALGYDEFGLNDADENYWKDFYTLQNTTDPIDNRYKSLLQSKLGYNFDSTPSNFIGNENTRNFPSYYPSSGRGGYQGPPLPGIMQGDPQGENRYASLGMNEFMVNVHSPMYTNRNRGGIMNLLGDY
jgi:hypothetical protein